MAHWFPGRILNMELHLNHSGRREVLEVSSTAEGISYSRDGGPDCSLGIVGYDEDSMLLDVEGRRRESSPVLRAPMPGKILEVLAAAGEVVVSGQALIRMEAMKMEIDVSAPIDGTVIEVAVAVGDLVDPDAELLRLDPSPDGS
jgi:biotin carboxyl carrier protein